MLDLTRYASYRGVVVHGDKRGRLLGFPTANVSLPAGSQLPPDGVYSTFAQFPHSGAIFGATASVGTNPTFDDVNDTRIEAYIHDLDETLYGLTVVLYLVQQLRGMQRFASVDELIAQTHRDVAESRRVLAALGI